MLSDLGATLAGRLREAEPAAAVELFGQAADAIAAAHEHGVYLGQPVARNIVVDGRGRVGFLDFEEDPIDVMSPHDAQVRDWLLFVAGSARHLPDDADLARRLRAPVAAENPVVRGELRRVAGRLGFLEGLARWRGSRASGLGRAVALLRSVFGSWALVLLLTGLGVDYLHDGEIELFEWIGALIE